MPKCFSAVVDCHGCGLRFIGTKVQKWCEVCREARLKEQARLRHACE